MKHFILKEGSVLGSFIMFTSLKLNSNVEP